jgi:cyclopropane fatty-acyl-phospholipid synthase-like methyltransferase
MDDRTSIVANYYSRKRTRLGYGLVMGRSQHMGYRESGQKCLERTAVQNFHKKFADLLALRGNEKILDAGCGQGLVSRYLLSEHSDIDLIGVTVTPHEVKYCKKMASLEGFAVRSQYLLCDYTNTDLADNSFDVIYTTETLSHSYDLAKTVNEFKRLLKPGGKLLMAEYEITDPETTDNSEYQEVIEAASAECILGIKSFYEGSFVRSLSQAGFSVSEYDWTANVAPSVHRLYRLAIVPYTILKILGLRKIINKNINMRAAVEFYQRPLKKGAFKYKIYEAVLDNSTLMI